MARPSDQPLDAFFQRSESTYIRISLGVVGGLCLFIALCWGGHRVYVRWQEHKLMGQAVVAFEKNMFREAAMVAQRAFAVDPSNLRACRMLATIAEQQNIPEAIEWRRRAVALEPDSLVDRLALSESALRFAQPAIGAEALTQVPREQKNDARYHATAAHVALTRFDLAAAEKHLGEAVRFAPNDSQRQLELAEFRLRSNDPSRRDQGRAVAQRLKSDPKVRLVAIHVLVNDAVRQRDSSASVDLARELAGLPGASFGDRLLALNILQALKDPVSTAVLTRLESESAQSAAKAVRLINWMSHHGLAVRAIDWSKRLPAEMLATIPMRLARADSYVQLHDWAALEEMLQQGSWARAESLRLAFQAKALRETGDDVGCEKNWMNAVAKADGDPARLNMLQTIAFQFGWTDKATAALWMLAENRDAQRAALQALYRYYAAQRDTTGLYRALARLVSVMPDDPAVRNNFAQISLLLNAEAARARGIARELYESYPQDAAVASTFAYALLQAGDAKGAVKVMSQLTSEQVKDPAVAAYYGIVLSETGRSDEAAYYLAHGEKAKLLPEEEDLVARAKALIARQ